MAQSPSRSTMQNRQKLDTRLVFSFGCLIGAAVFVAIYGFRVLNPLYDGWLLGSQQLEGISDLSQHYQGWLFYRKSSWHFPLGLVDGLYAEPVSIAYTDSIPLFAIVFKILSPILPKTFQYFGLFGLMCYCLVAGDGARLVSRFCNNMIVCQLGGFLFVISPVLLKRMFYHTALSAHFLVLIAIELYIISAQGSSKSLTYKWMWVHVAGLLINPYFVPMTLGIQLLSMLQGLILYWSRVAKRGRMILEDLRDLAVSVLGILISGYLLGLFYGQVSASAEGLRRLSFNLNQFINPANYLVKIQDYSYNWKTQNYSAILKPLANNSQWQEEGFAYLGLGVLGLLVAAAVVAVVKMVMRSSNSTVASHVVAVTLGAVVFTLLAMSPTITLGSKVLAEINYPKVVIKTLSVFRSAGRLIWPVYYGLITLALYGVTRIPKTCLKIVIVFAACIIQLIDIMPALVYKHKAYNQVVTYKSPLQDEKWDELADSTKHIYFYKGVHLGLYCDPEMSAIFEYYAYENDMDMNVSYLSRDVSHGADARTKKHFKELKSGARHSDNLYVFFDFSELPDEEEYGLEYMELDGYTVAICK